MNATRWIAPVAVVLAVNACAALKSPEAKCRLAAEGRVSTAPEEAAPCHAPGSGAVQPIAPPPEIKRLLEYFRSLKKLGSVELAREHDNARAAYARTRSDYDRLRLALVVSLPDTGFNDESRALELLEPMTRSQQSILNDLAILIHAFVSDTRSNIVAGHAGKFSIERHGEKSDPREGGADTTMNTMRTTILVGTRPECCGRAALLTRRVCRADIEARSRRSLILPSRGHSWS